MIPPWQKGIVKRIEQATPNTRRYWIELPETDSFDFQPGQFVTLDLPISEQRNKRWRSYSIASTPDGSNTIELVIVFVDGGAASNYIFSEVNEGHVFTLRGAQGTFVLPSASDRDLYFICTGTGIAPFRSMLHYINQHQIPHGKITLIFGTRKKEDLLYPEEMRELEKNIPGFSYRPVLSREEWAGDMGYVHPVYEALCTERKPSSFMLCGWRAMIDEARERITQMGYDRKDIFIEIYG
jgi:ferredoxin-NADP reductase